MSYQFTIRYEISDIGNHNEDQKKIFTKKKVFRMSRFVQKLNKKKIFLAQIFTKKYLENLAQFF